MRSGLSANDPLLSASAAVRHRRVLAAAFVLGLGVILLRDVILVLHPRFWAEEGQLYFALAYHEGPAALGQPVLGYFSLVSNVAAQLAAHVVPLEQAPRVTTLVAFLIQSVPLALVLFGRLAFLCTLGHRLAAAALVVVTAPSEEVWLNTINSQFHLALATALLLLEETDALGRAGRWGRRVLLVVAGLSGLVSCFLVPLFLLRALWRRRREDAVQAAVLSLCALVQGAVVLQVGDFAARSSPELDFGVISTVLATRTVLEPVLGSQWGEEVASSIEVSRRSPVRARNIGLGMMLGLAALAALVVHRQPRLTATLHLGSGLLLSLLCLLGSLGVDKAVYIRPGGGGRYFYAPAVLGCLLLLSCVRWRPERFERVRTVAVAGLLALSLVVNAAALWRARRAHEGWPRWAQQVQRWREDPRHPLELWPPSWTVQLDAAPGRSPRAP